MEGERRTNRTQRRIWKWDKGKINAGKGNGEEGKIGKQQRNIYI